ALYILISVVIALQQDRLVFPAPSDYPKLTPKNLGMPFEDLHIPVNGTDQIHAWYIPSANPLAKVIVYFHGNAYTIEDALSGEVRDLRETGASLLIVDYRGYGGSSSGQATGIRACEDARAALSYLTEQRHVLINNIFIVGRSIGTGVASQLALENPHAAGLVLLSPLTSVYAVARQNKTMRWLPLELMGSRNKLDTLAKIGQIHMPLLLIVGTQDTLTPPSMAQTLLEHANQPKQLYLVPDADHNDLWDFGGRSLIAKLTAFMDAVH
ncbi:MAG TPA: alpha/beta hydrolase, partial [Terriglobales bacterium]|nr:alpha/beta hydrolase [Terriglobales bacterium]